MPPPLSGSAPGSDSRQASQALWPYSTRTRTRCCTTSPRCDDGLSCYQWPPHRPVTALILMPLYLAKRVGLAAIVIVVIMVMLAVLVNLVPGDPARIILGPHATPQLIAQVR